MKYLPFDGEQLIHFLDQYVHMLNISIEVQCLQHEILNPLNDDYERLLHWKIPRDSNSAEIFDSKDEG